MRLIDIESPEIDAILDKYKYKDGGREYNRGVSDLLFQIMHAPTIDPIRHGRWIINPDGYYPYCSECREEPDNKHITAYCSACGAKMDTES